MNAIPTSGTARGFHAGDRVIVLYQGLYNGIKGRFVGYRKDPNWADIEEAGSSIRPHPAIWLRRPEELHAPALHTR